MQAPMGNNDLLVALLQQTLAAGRQQQQHSAPINSLGVNDSLWLAETVRQAQQKHLLQAAMQEAHQRQKQQQQQRQKQQAAAAFGYASNIARTSEWVADPAPATTMLGGYTRAAPQQLHANQQLQAADHHLLNEMAARQFGELASARHAASQQAAASQRYLAHELQAREFGRLAQAQAARQATDNWRRQQRGPSPPAHHRPAAGYHHTAAGQRAAAPAVRTRLPPQEDYQHHHHQQARHAPVTAGTSVSADALKPRSPSSSSAASTADIVDLLPDDLY